MALGETCSQTKKEFVYKKLDIFRTTSPSSGVHTPDDAPVVRNILIFLHTNSFSVCETT
jgi:hypothetical protein